jgi:hypothetical protein
LRSTARNADASRSTVSVRLCLDSRHIQVAVVGQLKQLTRPNFAAF